MRTHFVYLTIAMMVIMSAGFSVSGQDDSSFDCTAEALADFISEGTTDLDDDETSPAYLYRLGNLYTEFALACGYQPSFNEIETQIDRTLDFAPLSFIIAASSIGTDIENALLELETVNGDSLAGQLLYNGLEMGLDGTELGCSGCHNGEAAPGIEGSYTLVEEQRLSLPEFADYSVEYYMVESILDPQAYIVPEYTAVQMTANFGGRLDAQQLADLVAYLESQDQLLDDISETPTGAIECNNFNTSGCGEIIAEYTGDAVRGEMLYTGTELTENGAVLACTACHLAGAIAPDTAGTWTRITEERLSLPQFAGYTPEQYIMESFLTPGAYVVEGYVDGVMPLIYGEQLSYQDIADIVAYLQESG